MDKDKSRLSGCITGLMYYLAFGGTVGIIVGIVHSGPEQGDYTPIWIGICLITIAVLYGIGTLVVGNINNREASRREKEKARREEKKRRVQTRLEEERKRVIDLIRQTESIIQKAIIDASDAEEPLWLSALLIIEDSCHDISQEFERGGLLSCEELYNPARWQDQVGNTAKEIYADISKARASILEIKEQAEILSIPPPKEPSKEKTPEGINKEPTHYDILGIPPSANQDEIKRAYREKIKRLHSDRISSWAKRDEVPPEVLDFLEDTSKKINNAYEVLSDIDERGKYDEKIKR